MKEKRILKFRNKAIPYFRQILLEDNYEIKQAEKLAFYIVKILEDAYPLLQNFKKEDNNIEKIMSNIHLLYTNQHAFDKGKKILMFEK